MFLIIHSACKIKCRLLFKLNVCETHLSPGNQAVFSTFLHDTIWSGSLRNSRQAQICLDPVLVTLFFNSCLYAINTDLSLKKKCLLSGLPNFLVSVNSVGCFECNTVDHPECESIPSYNTSSLFYKICNISQSTEPFCRKTTLTSRFTIEYKTANLFPCMPCNVRWHPCHLSNWCAVLYRGHNSYNPIFVTRDQ